MNARLLIRIAIAGAGVSLLAACGAAPTGSTSSGTPPTAPEPQVSTLDAHVALTIATPDMLKTDTGPAFIPSSLTLPANSDVVVTIYNFDDATPLTGDATKFAKATGIVGSLQIEPVDTANPNGPATGQAIGAASIDPAKVSHTFTVPALGLNVPLAAKSRTVFTFHTGAAGLYQWHCMDPCGSGDTGWGGAMAMTGYMAGTLRIA